MNTRILSIAAIIFVTNILTNHDLSFQSIEINNNSLQPLRVSANTANQNFKVDISIPEFTRWLLVSKLSKTKAPQEALYEAIINDSPFEIMNAVKQGANINQPFNDKFPLTIAFLLQKLQAASCLVELGAIS
ncbi:MAG: hypothetical protein ACOYT8_00970 [Candidatus Dependentiae bacterium]